MHLEFAVISAALCCTWKTVLSIEIPTEREFVPSALQAINCLVRDDFNEEAALICSRHEIYRLHLNNMSNTLIAGNEYFSGYREGEGSSARFRSPRDLVQLNVTTLLVSDGLNHCIRAITGQTAGTYAGLCENVGFINGILTDSRFYWPFGMLKLGPKVLVCDQFNNAIREINLTNRQVSTFLQLSVLDSLNPPLPKRLACNLGSCDKMYLTFDHGVRVINQATRLSQLIAGGTGTGVSGPSGNTIQETHFLKPDSLLFLDYQQLFIAENRNGGKYVSFNFTNSRSRSYSGIVGESTTSIMCIGNLVYIGVRSGLYSMVFTEELPCSQTFVDDETTSINGQASPTTMPTNAPTTATTIIPTTTPTTSTDSRFTTQTTIHVTTTKSISPVTQTTQPASGLTTSSTTQRMPASSEGSINDGSNQSSQCSISSFLLIILTYFTLGTVFIQTVV